MLTDDELEKWYLANNISVEAQSVINNIRESDPARIVQGGTKNVPGLFSSQKMGLEIQFESHKVELPLLWEYETDDDVLEFYDQPPSFKLIYHSKSGKLLGVIQTTDFFVIRKNSAGWEEGKQENDLPILSQKSPERYVKGKNGTWRCPPGETYAQTYGLYYRIRSSAEINWSLQRNLNFLEDYLLFDTPKVTETARAHINGLVAAIPGIKLSELMENISPATTDDLYILLANNKLYVDLYAQSLAEYDRVCVYTSKSQKEIQPTSESQVSIDYSQTVNMIVGATVVWDGRPFDIVNIGQNTVWMKDQLEKDSQIVELPSGTFEKLVYDGIILKSVDDTNTKIYKSWGEITGKASNEDFAVANKRWEMISPFLNQAELPKNLEKSRNIYRLLANYREAEVTYGMGYVGLLPKRGNKGNRLRKLPDLTISTMINYIKTKWETIKQKRIREVWGEYIIECERLQTINASYKTFCDEVKRQPTYEQEVKMKGEKAAYSVEPIYLELTPTTPRHGDRPFEIGHIDHTEMDLELVDPETGKNLGKAWATYLTDAFSRRELAVILIFDPPSYRSCMMVIRECVRRHGRVPKTIIVDWGPEFKSIYFETLLAALGCILKRRPKSKSRFGGVCERLFGTSNTELVYNLLGNTQITKNIRQMSKKVNPKKLAVWTLTKFYEKLCGWAYETYDTIEHPALFQSPREAFNLGIKRSGERLHRRIEYNDDFKMLTLPSTSKGVSKVNINKGIKIRYLFYWCDKFNNKDIKFVPNRYEPYNRGVAYAYIKGNWVKCISEYYATMKGRTERELMIAAAEIRRKQTLHSRKFGVAAKQLAEMVISAEKDENLLMQQRRDNETKKVLEIINSTTSSENLNEANVQSHEKNSDNGVVVEKKDDGSPVKVGNDTAENDNEGEVEEKGKKRISPKKYEDYGRF
ncbi:DDE-type integrase/transposase/recombinase [Geomonas oryzae]|uniref:DDE-type integrase/transposase/recombinase n=1 Tax=Geomonas oryzae TaxID=2364273 RepID=UPI00100BB0FD|nr:DDE-type integrase/transposase/recombinase [Geomonas oryzae]